MKSEIQQIFEEASECLEDAKALFIMKRYKAVVSRAYYAMYHTAKAALTHKNIETFTHQGVNTQFAKHYIKSGIFEKSVIKAFSKMLDKRIKADYEIGFKADKDDAEFALSEANEFYIQINDFISHPMT